MTRNRIFWSTAGLLLALHVDPFNHGVGGALWWGWLPRDLAYHLGWVAVGTALLFYLTARIWKDSK